MPKKRKTPYVPILTGVTLAFALASAGFIAMMVYFNNPFTKVDDIDVPQLVGMKYETALVQYDNIVIDVVEEGNSDEYAKGVIYEQNPRYNGPKMKATTPMKVKVSIGPREVTLPNFAGQNAEQVLQKLREDGLEPREQREYSDAVPAGSVIYTDPTKGSTLGSGDIVTVYVSMGPKQRLAEVPADIIGMDVEQAAQYLDTLTFRIGNITEQADEAPAGTIIAVNPEAGTMQPEGTTLDVVVSKGGTKSAVLTIPLPSVSEKININAYDPDNKKLAGEEGIDTSEQDSWQPTITGEEGTTLEIRIFISTAERAGRRYQTYRIEFGEVVTQTLVDDRSSHSDFDF